jgi:hypothetical protein
MKAKNTKEALELKMIETKAALEYFESCLEQEPTYQNDEELDLDFEEEEEQGTKLYPVQVNEEGFMKTLMMTEDLLQLLITGAKTELKRYTEAYEKL